MEKESKIISDQHGFDSWCNWQYYNTEVIPKECQYAIVYSNFKRAVVHAYFMSNEKRQYTVNAGNNSDYSHSGNIAGEFNSKEEFLAAIDKANKQKKLFR